KKIYLNSTIFRNSDVRARALISKWELPALHTLHYNSIFLLALLIEFSVEPYKPRFPALARPLALHIRYKSQLSRTRARKYWSNPSHVLVPSFFFTSFSFFC
ncbi:MAG: hypothetical protein ACFFA3_16755, partial [Promethearchaeota archaeon]